MAVYLHSFRSCSSESKSESPTLYIKEIVLTIMLFCASTSAIGQTAQDEAPAVEDKEYTENIIRELREFKENYPLLARRLGFAPIQGFSLPFLCMGGIDPLFHKALHEACLANGGIPQECLEDAYRLSCQPAVVAQ